MNWPASKSANRYFFPSQRFRIFPWWWSAWAYIAILFNLFYY